MSYKGIEKLKQVEVVNRGSLEGNIAEMFVAYAKKINEIIEALNAEKAERCPNGEVMECPQCHYHFWHSNYKGAIDGTGKLSTSGIGEEVKELRRLLNDMTKERDMWRARSESGN